MMPNGNIECTNFVEVTFETRVTAKILFKRKYLVTALMAIMFPAFVPLVLSETFKPTNPDLVLETLTRRGLSTALPPEFRARRLALRKSPNQLDLALSLADELLKFGRRTSDPRFYGEAEAVLKPWWTQSPPPIAVLFRRANILQFNHRFDDALKDLAAYLQGTPDDIQARLMEATVFQVTGQYVNARKSCEAIAPRRQMIYRTLCLSSASAMLDDPRPIYANLRVMTRDTSSVPPSAGTQPNPEELYALSVLADVAIQLNDTKVAIESLRRILANEPSDIYAIITLADLLLDANKMDEVVPLTCSNPDHDGLLLRCARSIRTSDPKGFQDKVAMLDQRIEAERRRQSPAHLREIAYYLMYLKDAPSDALNAAVENYKTQREPIDARMLLEAAAARNDRKGGGPAVQWVKDTRFQYEPFVKLSTALGGVP